MRSLPPWTGKTDDTPVPRRVRLRVFCAYEGICQCGCDRIIRPGEAWKLDHYVPLISGGGHCETNLRPLLKAHHAAKTGADVAEKARTARVRAAHIGVKRTRRRWGYGRGDPYRKKLTGEIVKRET
jgi:5-methylcytosine-specific restriction enzyme A